MNECTVKNPRVKPQRRSGHVLMDDESTIQEVTAELYYHYVRCGALAGAATLLTGPQGEGLDESILLQHIAQLVQSSVSKGGVPDANSHATLVQLQRSRWGQAHLKDRASIDQLQLDTDSRAALKAMLCSSP